MSSGLNNCDFIGTVLKKPVIQRYKIGETIVCTAYLNLSIARTEGKSKQKYDDLDFKATGQIAENIEKWITKGSSIGVQCRAEKNRWQKGGRWYTHTIFRIRQLFFLDNKGDAQPNAISDEVTEIDIDTSGLEEAEYHDIDFSALD